MFGFDKKIIAYLDQAGFVYGHSAGSIIFGNDIISTTYDTENIVGLDDSKGINLVKGFDICCHYSSDREYKRKRIQEHSTQSQGVIALSDGCGLFVSDEEITFIGSGIVIFT